MNNYEFLLLLLIALAATSVVLLIFVLIRTSEKKDYSDILDKLRHEVLDEQRGSRRETTETLNSMSGMLNTSLQNAFQRQDARLDALTKGVGDSLGSINERFKSFSVESEQKLDNIRTTMEKRLGSMQEDNSKKLELMRQTVDEKLQ